MQETYFRIRLNHVPTALEELIATHGFACGATGVSEALPYTQPDLAQDPHILQVKDHQLDIYFSQTPSDEFLEGLKRMSPSLQWTIHEEQHQDWLAEWKKDFKAFKLVGPFWVVPSWLAAPNECRYPLFIDPGMAFGTGTHATTQLAAFLLHKLSKSQPSQTENFLDVGTGTGILAMLARYVGYRKITALEVDSEARKVARRNMEANKMLDISIPDIQLAEIDSQYSVVMANIIDSVLVKIKEELLAALKEQGYLILSGILLEHEEEFFEQFLKDPRLLVDKRVEKGEWVAFGVKKIETLLD